MAVCTRENTSSFFDLQSMLLVEENHAGASTSTHADSKMLYTEDERPHARGGRGESVRNGGDRQRTHQRDADSNPGPSGSRGSRGETAPDCWYCGKKGHRESEYWKKRAESGKTASRSGSGRTDRGNRQRSHYAERFRGAGEASAFVTRHEANSMKKSTPKSDEVWYVDFGVSRQVKAS